MLLDRVTPVSLSSSSIYQPCSLFRAPEDFTPMGNIAMRGTYSLLQSGGAEQQGRLASSPHSVHVYIDHKVLQSKRSSGWKARYYYLHLLLPTKEIKRQMTGNEDFKNRHL